MLLDLLFPKYCINCNKTGAYLCQDCTPKITRHLQVCFVCRKYSPFGQTHSYCKALTSFNSVIIATEYKNLVKKALVKIKYGLNYAILNELLTQTLSSHKIQQFLRDQHIDLCTEIPMHHYKQNQRGFNQTTLIAQWIEKNYHVPHQSVLTKTQSTHAQMHLNRNDRLFNLSNTFEIKPNQNLHHKNILLIDDVTTTGTTLEEAAQLLKKHGAQKIIGLVIASG